ncbi:potassium voltage-gated channel subfamily G member 2-like [Micropterus salmoides]|uniref:potassium voltage-gated channel subfamily G member 2-like n=1 Tax=Micropterus salmoides TaxID=27706 RepID=UPI0018ED069E|nr:potassium voltage-gated channel subfamily G member 2-like [Micropterus salmoides]XP_038568200.1 potassium voltage-gated channel subfamily G member 2-like [Micropterus salmoides]
MAIISAGFDDQSFSSEDSYSHVFTDSETTVKGLYFQRAQLLRGSEALRWYCDPTEQALVNVGGIRYAFPWSTLEDVPQSRLSRLRFCTTLREIAEFCDDYDEMRHEFFFDRDPLAFRAILNLLAKGKLRLQQEVCNVALHNELLYWGINVGQMEPCCRHRMMSSLEQVTEHQRKENEWRERRRALRAPVAEGSLFHMLGEAVENPHSGLAGKVFAFMSVIMVVVTVVSLCISTMSDEQEEGATGKCSQKCRDMFMVESFCVAWFSLEFLVRFFHAQSKLEFVRCPLNIIDAAAILPYYVSLFLELRDESVQDIVAGAGKSTMDKLGLILRMMRALRILYVMRLARHSLGLQTLGLTIHRSMTDFSLLLLFVCISVTLFSPLVHLAESELAPNSAKSPQLSFSSIPASYWWSIISVTTVGYGDMVPHSIPGQFVALISILSGILILSFPSTSIFHTFQCTYNELKEEHKRLWKEERGAELATEAEESMKERETWPDDWPETDLLPGLDDPYYLFVKDITVLARSKSHQPLLSPVTC